MERKGMWVTVLGAGVRLATARGHVNVGGGEQGREKERGCRLQRQRAIDNSKGGTTA